VLQSHELWWADPVMGRRRSEGNWDDRAETGLLVNHQIVISTSGPPRLSNSQASRTPSATKATWTVQCACERQSQFIGHVNRAGPVWLQRRRSAPAYRKHRGGGAVSEDQKRGLAQEAGLGSQ